MRRQQLFPGLNGYESLVNFQMIASHVFTTEEIVTDIKNSKNNKKWERK
jgi:hypothetical protein